MEFARLLLVSLVMAVAPLIGFIISFYTREELDQGKSYLVMIQRLLLLILAMSLILRRTEVYFSAIIIISMIFFYFIDSVLLFMSFATLLFTSAFYGALFNYASMFIFLYFVFYGLLSYQKKLKGILLSGGVFLATTLALCLVWKVAF